jgi:hypothetical protein
VPEKRIPYFKPGKELKDLINEGGPASIAEAPPVTQSAPSGATSDRSDDRGGDS